MKNEKKGKEWKERRERSKKRNIGKCTKLKKRQIKKIIMKKMITPTISMKEVENSNKIRKKESKLINLRIKISKRYGFPKLKILQVIKPNPLNNHNLNKKTT